MNRFQKSHFRLQKGSGILLPLLTFLVIITLFLYGLNSISQTTINEQSRTLENAINRNILHFYSAQGRYPANLAEIETQYPLIYDHNQYKIFYEPIGENILPDVTILDLRNE